MFLFSSALIVTAVAGAGILLLPGILVLALAPGASDLTVPERLAFGAATSWCILTAACLSAFTLGWSVPHVEVALLCVNAGLATRWFYRRRRRTTRPVDAWQVAVLVGIAATAILAFRVGGYTNPESGPTVAVAGWSTMEEMLQVSTARKVAGAPGLRVDEVMYAKGEFPTYIYPIYPFALAVVSRASGLDPMVLFDTFRLWTAALGLLAFHALATAATGRRAGTVATLSAVALVLIGQAGQAAGFGSWGQLIPVSHMADFGLGVLLPLALAVILRFIVEERGHYVFTVLAPVFLAAVALTHTREAAHMTSYMGAALVVGPAIGAFTTRQWVRLACLVAGTVLFVAAYSAAVQHKVPFIREHEEALAARARVDSSADLRSGVGYSVQQADVPRLIRPYVTFAFFIAPIALICFRSSPTMVVLVAGLLCWWAPLHVPIVGRVLERVVYSEVMATPSRYVFHISYLLYGVTVYAALCALDRALDARMTLNFTWERLPPRIEAGVPPPVHRLKLKVPSLLTACLAALVIASGPWLVDRLFGAHPLRAAAVAAAAAVLGARSRASTAIRTLFTSPGAFRHPWWVAATAILALGVLVRGSETTNLFEAGKARRWRQVRNAEEWYEHAAVRNSLPWRTAQMLRTSIPPRSIIASDPTLGLAIPFAVDHYILVSGTNFTTDLHYLEAIDRTTGVTFEPDEHIDWAAYRAKFGGHVPPDLQPDIVTWEKYFFRLRRLVAISSSGPSSVFSGEIDTAQRIDLLNALRPDYLLTSSKDHVRLLQFMASLPDRFERVAADDRFEIYRPRYSGDHRVNSQ